ncbi:hypothetical protein AKJ37_04500 [candidate division MSBL1 archaeon SCGC-AAA259I09]|uniref:MoaB/Mog domain-containing protein n=3 Tax=candidate division MSBL1 TaxID=215777 RepID=A0A133UUI6_9EURY|nr:hypothetical protein AKJ61_02005 [candidate division MSBL1 archaeon SCGC-AAA259B11]KXA96754.1 hypothetical protein AKJ37_04500 [candidate division MSBL1 archaeon SCGC-AAA259I09]KXA97819.1 hypothetical protein AKJ38_00040 [candidate division MSBL1 archaeon SCGC-AAA259I14]
MTTEEHRKEAPKELHVGVITVSDTRSAAMKEGRDEDESGKIIQERLKESEFTSERVVIPDEPDDLGEKLSEYLNDPEVDAIITTGGTGIAKRDITIDVARKFFDKELPGFGEFLRRKGYEMVGIFGILTRTTLGIAGKKPIFCLPGAPNSVRVGMDLITSDLAHIVKHARE